MPNKVPDNIPRVERYLVFSGPINNNATKILRNACCDAVVTKVTALTILFSSEGGSVEDGFSLYGFLSALPLELTMHNIGAVTSIATVVFLAGDRRYASQNTLFYVHDETWSLAAQEYTNTKLHEFPLLLDSGRNRAKSIFKLRTKIDQSVLEGPDFFKEPAVYEPSVAKTAGIIDEIQDAAIPYGGTIYNITWG